MSVLSTERLGGLSISTALITAVLLIITKWLWRGINIRRTLSGLPGPGHSYILGSLKQVGETAKKLPSDIHPWRIMALLSRNPISEASGVAYIDVWPITTPLMLVTKPATILQAENFPKAAILSETFGSIVGRNSILTKEYDGGWKPLRALFSPGFSHANIVTLLPFVVEQCEIFMQKMRNAVKEGNGRGFVKSTEDWTTYLTSDIIFGMAIGYRSRCQTQEGKGKELVHNIIEMSKYPRILPSILLPPVEWWYEKRQINPELDRLMTKRWRLWSENRGKAVWGNSEDDEFWGDKNMKTIMDLAFQSWYKENKDLDPELKKPLPKQFHDEMVDNLKTFFFAGHDTTASVLCMVLFEFTRQPEVLAAIRAEHEAVFGSVETTIPNMFSNPGLLNKIPYSTAFFRELLRLYTPASGVRQLGKTREQQFITGLDGVSYPVPEGFILWIVPIHRDPEFFPRPHSFHPERFLSEEERASGKYPCTVPEEAGGRSLVFPPNLASNPAYRPFERGPRNCIGQELAMVELKVFTILLARQFNLENAFKEDWKKDDWLSEEDGGPNAGYPIIYTTAKPKDGMPVYVTMRKEGKY